MYVQSICKANLANILLQSSQNSGVPGGINSADPNSPEINELAKKLVDKLDADSGSNCKQKVNRVLNATSQVCLRYFRANKFDNLLLIGCIAL